MASTKIWTGSTDGVFTTASNFKPISIRNSLYRWIVSGSGTNEYYMELIGGGDPSQEDPFLVQEDGSDMTEAAAGSLTAGQWDYADNDTLGFSTVYVRLTLEVDPDTKEIDFVTFTNTPVSGDTLVFENSAVAVTSGFDQAAIALAALRVDMSYTGIFGTAAVPRYLNIGSALVDIGTNFHPGTAAGSGQLLFDLEDDADTTPTVVVHNTGQPTTSTVPALRLLVIDTSAKIEVRKGSVGVASETGEFSTVDTVHSSFATQKTTDAKVFIGDDVTLETLEMIAGDVVLRSAVSTAITIYDGTLLTDGSGVMAVINVKGGVVTSNSTGNITALNVTGGLIDFTKSDNARTVVTPRLDWPGKISLDIDVITLTNEIKPANSGPVQYSATRV